MQKGEKLNEKDNRISYGCYFFRNSNFRTICGNALQSGTDDSSSWRYNAANPKVRSKFMGKDKVLLGDKENTGKKTSKQEQAERKAEKKKQRKQQRRTG